jgi:hypothetical protein
MSVDIWNRHWGKLSRKVAAYRSLEGCHGWPVVVADLAAFCSYRRPTTKISPVTASVDPIAMAIAEGRREVFLRILEMMDTNDIKIRSWMHDEMMQLERGNEDVSEFR